jgi:PAS domain-containing protein
MSMPDITTAWQARLDTQWTYWPVLLATVLLAISVPWYLGLIDVDLRVALWGVLGACVAIALVSQRGHTGEPTWLTRTLPHVLGVALLSGLWFALGAFRLPTFLILFGLPVFSAAFVSRGWFEYAIGGLCIAGVGAAAVFASPALRWYLQQFELFPAWLSLPPSATLSPYAARVDADQQALTLAHFAIAMLAACVLSSTTARVVDRLARELAAAARARDESAELARTLLRDAVVAEALVTRRSGTIVSANTAFRELIHAEAGADETLLQALAPVYPEPLRAILESHRGGDAPGVLCRNGGRYRVLDIGVRPVASEGEPLHAIRVRETSRSELAVAAFENLDVALLVLGPDGRVLFRTRSFTELFPDAAVGTPAPQALGDRYGLPSGWWEVGAQRRTHVRFETQGRMLGGTVTASGGELAPALAVIRLETEAVDV